MNEQSYKKLDGEIVLGEFKDVRVGAKIKPLLGYSNYKYNILLTNKRIFFSLQRTAFSIPIHETYDTCSMVMYFNKDEAKTNLDKLGLTSFKKFIGPDTSRYIPIKKIELVGENLIIDNFEIYDIGKEMKHLIKDIFPETKVNN